MAKKPNGRYLITWNKKKHPEIEAFFDSIEEGMYAHYIRKAIKFYMENKGEQNNAVNFQYNNHMKTENNKQVYSTNEKPGTDDDKYVEFDPSEIGKSF